MALHFITGNKNKFTEIQSILPNIQQLDIDLVEMQEIDPHKIIAAKLHQALQHHDGPLIVEDTSLYMDALNGLPGPLIKWFLKALGTDGTAKLVPEKSSAYAKTLIGYAKNKNEIHFFEGEIQGKIVMPRGEKGFGWDAIFQPDEYDKTFAEMIQEEKNTVSMRKIAAMKLQEFLQSS